jgi:hypothetical protein
MLVRISYASSCTRRGREEAMPYHPPHPKDTGHTTSISPAPPPPVGFPLLTALIMVLLLLLASCELLALQRNQPEIGSAVIACVLFLSLAAAQLDR